MKKALSYAVMLGLVLTMFGCAALMPSQNDIVSNMVLKTHPSATIIDIDWEFYEEVVQYRVRLDTKDGVKRHRVICAASEKRREVHIPGTCEVIDRDDRQSHNRLLWRIAEAKGFAAKLRE